jgi:signal transduction histidine kinase
MPDLTLDSVAGDSSTVFGDFGYDAPTDNPAPLDPADAAVVVQTPLHLPQSQAPIGYAQIAIMARDINQIVLQARLTGLVITALSMSVLFSILLLVVARADQIITVRNEELSVAYQDLREAEAMRDDLTNMIVHDLKNPLTTIYGTLGLVKSLNAQDQPDTSRYYVEQALRASERMTGLIEDILAVSKMEAGQLEPDIKLTVVGQLLAESLDSFVSRAKEEKKQLTLTCPDDLEARLDVAMISRVIENLLSNALKYTDPGGQIQLSAWIQVKQLYIRIRDDGQGISDAYKQQIFGKFAQAPNANEKPERKGTGLGLAFCSLAVQQHGGTIWVEDAPGGGSDFVFSLPQA